MGQGQVIIIKHPLVQHKLTLMRKKETSSVKFRALTTEVSLLLGYEITRELEIEYAEIETPLATMQAPVLKGKKLVVVSILRAGNGILDGLWQLIPNARVGHVGLYRDPLTLGAIEYYVKLPENMEDRDVIVTDPLLATGNSAIAAVKEVKETNPKSIKFLCIIAASKGIKAFHEEHPEVDIYTAAVDERLDDKGYIIPGLGDAGDRIFGTKLHN